MPAPTSPPDPAVAFRQRHEQRLAAFGILLSLGHEETARRAVEETLALATAHLSELDRPEHAGVWLRREVVARTPAGGFLRRTRPAAGPDGEVPPVLERMGVDSPTLTALAALDLTERAALLAADVERLSDEDVADLLGLDPSRVDVLLRGARQRFARAYERAWPEAEAPELTRGPIAEELGRASKPLDAFFHEAVL